MYAAAFGHREIVLLILAAFKKLHHVAVQGQRNGQGLTAWQLAEKNGHEDIAALLKVESQSFGRPAGPSCFVPANPLDLDRPPTPTETTAVRSSLRRLKNAGRSNTVPLPTDLIAPLQPTGPLSTECRRRRSCKVEDDICSTDAAEEPHKTRKEERTGLLGGGLRTSEGPLAVGGLSKQEVDIRPKEIENLIGSASIVVKSAIAKPLERDLKSRANVAKGLSTSRCRANRLINSALGSAVADVQNKWPRDQELSENTGKKPENLRNDAGGSLSKPVVEKDHKLLSRTEPLLVSGPDATERQVLEELMKDLTLSGSPGSGNEADTESLMECEGSPREDFTSSSSRMSGPNNRKMTLSNVPLTVAALTSPNASMPKIDLSSSTRSLNRSIQHLVQEDTEIRPGQRPPTPARPSLPTLLPGRLLDTSLNASLTSTKSEGRYAPPSRRVTFSSFPRSSSEPRSLTASPRPHQNPENDYDDDSDEISSDLLDSSTRSEGWDHLRGTRGRGPSFATPSEGHVVTLPPINQCKYTEAGIRGRDGARGRGGGMSTHGENVLSVAKKTLEQLETVLAPSEGPTLARSIPRTRATHQIHLET